MEPRRPKHKQQPPLVVTQDEIEHALQRPESYHHTNANATDTEPPLFTTDAKEVEVVHTHLSMVFLLPQRVYKLKKPVNFGFVDFSTLYKRFQACVAEVHLNQRLAPHIYKGVVPVRMHRETRAITVACDDAWTPEKNDRLEYWVDDELGEIIEWAVHMVRLPDACTLHAAMESGALTAATLRHVARTLVQFHQTARRGPRIDAFGREDVVRRNIDENFAQTVSHIDGGDGSNGTVSRPVYDRVQELTYAQLEELAPTIQARVDHGYTCDCHGDLRLEHIYAMDVSLKSTAGEAARQVLSPTLGANEKQLIVLDCIEFNEQFRFGDPLSDVAFLMMDVWRMGRPDLARLLQHQYLVDAAQDTPENHRLFRLYAAYRAVVRAKVSGFRVADASLNATHRESERQRARGLWLVALTLLSPPHERPCLLLVGGLPASGKSTLAQMLVGDEAGNIHWLRADAIRKAMAVRQLHACKEEKEDNEFEAGLYAPEVTVHTYDEILTRCVQYLRQGERVVVDATFRDPQLRARFMQTAYREGALWALIICSCDREIIKGRMLARAAKTHELSDATWDVYEHMERHWRLDEVQDRPEVMVINTEKEKELTLRRTNGFLRQLELL